MEIPIQQIRTILLDEYVTELDNWIDDIDLRSKILFTDEVVAGFDNGTYYLTHYDKTYYYRDYLILR